MKLTMILFFLLTLVACEKKEDSNPANSPSPAIAIKYEITGTAATVSITYQNKDDGTSQIAEVSLPWALEFSVPAGQFLYISAQNKTSHGRVTVKIFKNNTEFKSSTSAGAYVIATASGSA